MSFVPGFPESLLYFLLDTLTRCEFDLLCPFAHLISGLKALQEGLKLLALCLFEGCDDIFCTFLRMSGHLVLQALEV